MKTILVLSLVFISAKNFSQTPLGNVYVKSTRVISETETKSSYVKGYANNIPASVMENFNLRFPKAENVSWFVNDKKISGYFSENNQQVNVEYKKDGLFVYARKTYEGSMLDQSAKDFLERETGYALPVKYVTEIIREKESEFEVSIEDEKRWHIFRFGHKNGQPFSMIEKTSFKKG